MDTLNLLSDYFLITLLGLIIGLALILLLRKQHLTVRIFSDILLFIVMWDVMTPLTFLEQKVAIFNAARIQKMRF